MADARSRPPPQEGKVRIQMEFGEIKQMFDMKANRPFSQPMHMFAKKIQREMSFLRFSYNGTRIQEMDTANSIPLEVDELDKTSPSIIEVNLMQIGG